MPITMLDAVDFAKVPAIGFIVPMVGTDPAVGYEGGMIYNTSTKEVKYYDGIEWVVLNTQGADAPPSGTAGGDLAGLYPNPDIAANVIINNDISLTAAIAQTKIAGSPGYVNLFEEMKTKVPTSRRVIAGPGLTGGGDLANNVTLSLNATSLSGLYVDVAGDTMAGSLDMGGYKITSLPDTGTYSALDAAPIWYVDQRASGVKLLQEVRAATVTPITLSGLQTIDGVALAANDRVLVRNQHNGSTAIGAAVTNGVYTVAAGAWARAADANTSGEIQPGSVVAVTNGTSYAGITFSAQVPTSQIPWTPGTSDNYWFIFTSRTVISAGNGLVLTGNTIDLVPHTDGTLVATPDNVRVASAPKWTTARTLTLSGDIEGSVSVDGTADLPLTTTIKPGVIVDADVSDSAMIKQSKIENLEDELDDKVGVGRKIIAGAGLTGTNTLAADVTLNVAGNATIAVSADSIGVVSAPKWTNKLTLNIVGDVVGTAQFDGSEYTINMPTTVVSGGGTVKTFVTNVGAGTSVDIVHNLGTRDVTVQVYRTISPWDTVNCTVERFDVNTVRLKFATAVTAGQYRVVIQGS